MLPGGQYARGWVGLFLFIALGRMVTFCKEGGGMLSVWALRARSYKTKAEAGQQGKALHPPQRVYLVYVLLPVRSERVQEVQKSQQTLWVLDGLWLA